MFELVNNQLVVDPNMLVIPWVKAIWDADKSKDKSKAFKDLSYIYFLVDYKSPFYTYPETSRMDMILDQIVRDNKWEASNLVLEGIDRYKETNRTQTMGLLEDARVLVEKLRGYFREADFSELDDQGKLVYSPKEAMSNLAGLGKVVESLDILNERVKKEITQKTSVRGNKTLTSYSDPD